MRSKLYIFSVVILFTGVLMIICCDKYMFENALLLENWIKTRQSMESIDDAGSLFSLNRSFWRKLNIQTKQKLILLWKAPFGAVDANQRACPGCLMTYDQTALDIADAVVFHFVEIRDSFPSFPIRNRKPGQRWIWLCMEPPWNVRFVFQKTLTPLNGIFNWTMTYRTDSDVLSSYMRTFSNDKYSIDDLIRMKNATSIGAWMVSNCDSSERSQLVEKLKRYIPIDVYGQCSGKPLCRGKCQQETLSRYKFYFALENSRCKDYITEKFWHNGLASYTVPVVLGPPREDYELVAPPNSFIHVDDFENVKDLANYLIELDQNDEMYSKYLHWRTDEQWKKKQSIKDHKSEAKGLLGSLKHGNGLCGLCNKLKSETDIEPQVVENLDQWWYGNGYSPNKDSFPVCSPYSGPSGKPLGWAVTLGYSFCYVCITAIAFCCCCKFKRI